MTDAWPSSHIPTLSNVRLSSAYVKCRAGDWFTSSKPRPGAVCQIPTSRSGSLKGRGRRSTPSTTLKMAALLPIPTARVSTATALNMGARRSLRTV